ncbi:MAG TPA: hypothetical protein VD794_02125 [Flavisolibacter sp.]|nr:hypothetical protein [Flavisolibacter sp.]
MKKHQLLEKAMRDYPAGTKLRPPACDESFESTGLFEIHEECGFANVLMNYSNRIDDVFVFLDGEWAETVKPSILDGKVAIQVKNEREFKLLMEHYESKGFKSFSGVGISRFFETYNITSNHGSISTHVRYGDEFSHCKQGYFEEQGYKIIPFADFAAEVGIKVPVFIMKSEDGVDLYEGDEYHRAYFDKAWVYDFCTDLKTNHAVNRKDQWAAEAKAFSTKEAAEAWIEEQNRPKHITVSPNSIVPIHVFAHRIEFGLNKIIGRSIGEYDVVGVTAQELEEVWSAYQQLKGASKP